MTDQPNALEASALAHVAADAAATFGVVPVKASKLAANAAAQPRRLVERIRFQVGVGLIVCILIPMLVRSWVDGTPWQEARLLNSGIISAFSLLAGYYASRSMMPFRGATIATFSIPTLTGSFALAAVIPLFARIEYSRTQLAIHFVLTVLFFVLTERATARLRQLRFAIIPGGRVGNFPKLDNVQLVRLRHHEDAIHQVDGVIADLNAKHSAGWDKAMTRSLLAGVPVYHWKQLVEQLCGTVEIDNISENSLGSLNPNQFYLKIKQAMDIVVALLVLVLLWPVMLFIALLIRIESPGPAIFKQERTGFRAKSFTVFKFRTMRFDTQDGQSKSAARHSAITRDGDARITRVGNVLRRTRLDELPQFINVLRFEMSLIGPRPEALELTLWYEQELPFYHYRHLIKPGITGWAQVNQGHVAGIDDTRVKLAYDFYYVKFCSLWLDILIAARTIVTAFTTRGAK
ncbi:MAG: sugar transferase [Sphingopyxis sp.]